MSAYKEIEARLFAATASRGMSLGLDAMQKLSHAFGNPHLSYPTVHVAGTNGKGSVSTKIAKGLELSGLKVGLYTSPHISSFCERIVVQGQPISEEAVAKGMAEIFPVTGEATFFEITTLLAFHHFAKEKVDVAVIEVGLGGRLDATNLITPLLSVITSISRDHSALLGESLEEIAAEKAGIIKPAVPLVIGPKAHYQSIYQKAEEMQAPLIETPTVDGFYDAENNAIAQTALVALKAHFPITGVAIEKAMAIRPPCRFETIGRAILDVAHNPDGFRRLFQALDLHYPGEPMRMVIGMSGDKEIAPCLEMAARRARHIHLVRAPTERAATLEQMAAILRAQGYTHYTLEPSIPDAIQSALAHSERLLICGSFFIMHEAHTAAQKLQPS